MVRVSIQGRGRDGDDDADVGGIDCAYEGNRNHGVVVVVPVKGSGHLVSRINSKVTVCVCVYICNICRYIHIKVFTVTTSCLITGSHDDSISSGRGTRTEDVFVHVLQRISLPLKVQDLQIA